jgi:class 3 adenylate cyclase/tetratricopeptide (TPR) repeat protein
MDDLTSDSPTLPSALSGAGGALAGRYEVRRRLGRGATKEVYLAYDARHDREVALAIVVGAATDVARARVAREAQVTGRLGDHPHVITVYDSGEHDGVPYLVLRAMLGGSLAERIAHERLTIDDAMRLGGEIASALAHAHDHGVVHRDVKPDNVWLAADGSAALGDFGIAHELGGERLTAEGIVVGTVRYISPEQIRGEDIGPSGDLYALGVTLYELVCGRVPFSGADATQVLAQHLSAAPVPPSRVEPGVSPELEHLILELLAKTPADRPASAAAVAQALAAMRRPAPAPAATRRPDSRRLVSVLVARADADDPEVLHGVLDRCAAVIEQHGGSVEPYLGDGVVGYFGLDGSHGDDAMRAARAATELLSETGELRLGIESGEVFLSSGRGGATVARGVAITSAGQLAERATHSEILLGDRIRQAVAQQARVDPASGRLLELHGELPGLLRAYETPFVGRARELGELLGAFERTRDEAACHLVTVAGAPGIGKSRLAREFVTAVGEQATVLAGRCLSYGEGTTYRALAEIVRGLGGDPRRRVEELLAGDEQAIRGLLGAIGLSDEPAQAEETAWAVRRLLERVARDRPLVVAVEDIHWAQPVLLDLLDHVVALSSGAPILLVCLTRPELLDQRPAWAAPQPNRALVVLDALTDADARELAQALGAGEPAARIAARAEGNPLFVEQLVAVDAGQDEGELPASIQAVLAARIDGLEPAERTLLQHASVEGRTFHAGALATLLPASERRAIATTLVALARKGLVVADRAEFAGEDAFRFTHALIGEAAYAGMPKSLRAELHGAVADWLEQQPGAADEIVGYHLEQACMLRRGLGHDDEPERMLAARAAQRLQSASHVALSRGDPTGASVLLERAIALIGSDGPARAALLAALGASLFEAGRITEATRVLDTAIDEAPDSHLAARARIERELVRLEAEPLAGFDPARRVSEEFLPVLQRDGDDYGQYRGRLLDAQVGWLAGQLAQADEAWRTAAEFARRAGHEQDLFHVLRWRASAAAFGPTPVAEAIVRCEEFLEVVAASPLGVAWSYNALAVVHAMNDDFELADRFVRDANQTLAQIGGLSSIVSHHEAVVRMLAGQPELAELPLRAGFERLVPLGEGGLLATTTAMLAQAVYAQGRTEEAGELCELASAAAATDDILTQVIWRGVRAKVLAREGRCSEAETLARGAVGLIERTDMLSDHGDALLDLAEVLSTCSRPDEARSALQRALALYETKGNIAAERQARSVLGRT